MEGASKEIELTEQHIVYIMYNTLCSMNFLHTANIMHRDIKPANLLIDNECGVKICDFGLARTCLKQENADKEDTNQDELPPIVDKATKL